MTRKRRNHSPEFKDNEAFAAAKDDKTITELTQQFSLHPNQITTLKRELIDYATAIFLSGSSGKKSTEEADKLHSTIGEFTMENDFLTKVLER